LIFGRHPAVPFLLLLTISADAIGLACVALLHPVGDAHPLIGLGLMALAIGSAAGLRRGGVGFVGAARRHTAFTRAAFVPVLREVFA
jgi:hypothetical protein